MTFQNSIRSDSVRLLLGCRLPLGGRLAIVFVSLCTILSAGMPVFAQQPVVVGQPLISILPAEAQPVPAFEAASLPVGVSSWGCNSFAIGNVEQSFATGRHDRVFAAGNVSQSIRLRKNVLGCQANYHVRPEDEIWVLSVRDFVCGEDDLDRAQIRKLENGTWQESTLHALTEAHRHDGGDGFASGRTTLMYIHGNQTNREYGVARGFQLYNNLFVETECVRPPVRLVLWLWKSDREAPRLYTDFLIKSRRAVEMGTALARTLERFGDRRMALVGFSLGAQVILSSLEQMEPECKCEQNDDKFHIALIAPATDPTYVCNVIHRHVESSIVRKSIIVENEHDRAVRALQFIIRRQCPEARESFSQLAFENHFPLAKTELFEVSRELSCVHAIQRYTEAPTVVRAISKLLAEVGREL